MIGVDGLPGTGAGAGAGADRGTGAGGRRVAQDLVPTPSQTIGPYLSIGLRPLERSTVVPPGTGGSLTIGGRVLDGAGEPVPDAVVELWQADPDGRFAAGDGSSSWFGRSLADAAGRFRFCTVKPGRVALPSGALQAPHLELLVFARGLLRPVRTRMYFPDEAEANDADPVLIGIADRRQTLVAVGEDGGLRFDVRLHGATETVFFAL